jgi:hypothetical protein
MIGLAECRLWLFFWCCSDIRGRNATCWTLQSTSDVRFRYHAQLHIYATDKQFDSITPVLCVCRLTDSERQSDKEIQSAPGCFSFQRKMNYHLSAAGPQKEKRKKDANDCSSKMAIGPFRVSEQWAAIGYTIIYTDEDSSGASIGWAMLFHSSQLHCYQNHGPWRAHACQPCSIICSVSISSWVFNVVLPHPRHGSGASDRLVSLNTTGIASHCSYNAHDHCRSTWTIPTMHKRFCDLPSQRSQQADDDDKSWVGMDKS